MRSATKTSRTEQCVEIAGARVAVVPGDAGNVKLTTATDFELVRLRVGEELELDCDASVATENDFHRLVAGRGLVLCGVEIPYEKRVWTVGRPRPLLRSWTRSWAPPNAT